MTFGKHTERRGIAAPNPSRTCQQNVNQDPRESTFRLENAFTQCSPHASRDGPVVPMSLNVLMATLLTAQSLDETATRPHRTRLGVDSHAIPATPSRTHDGSPRQGKNRSNHITSPSQPDSPASS